MAYNRKYIRDALLPLGYNIHNIGASYKEQETPYLVLKMTGAEGTTNRLGRMREYQILCYSPVSSMVLLDNIVAQVVNAMKHTRGITVTNVLGEDYLDEDINMYMQYVTIEVPEVIGGCV